MGNPPTGFRENGLDISEKYVGIDDADLMQDHLTTEGKDYYLGGGLYVTGLNGVGQHGIGTIANVSTPSLSGGSYDWVSCATSGYVSSATTCAAVRSDGTLWSWGAGNDGQHGLGNITDYSSPMQVGSDTDWKIVRKSFFSTVAQKRNGTIWGCGRSALLQGTLSTLTQLGAYTDWKEIELHMGGYSTMTITNDGKLWGIGLNNNGKLGNGTLTSTTTPVQVGTESDWIQVSCGDSHCIGLRSNGTAWVWGSNAWGQFGDGTVVNKSTPIQVGVATDWVYVACGYQETFAINEAGELWYIGGQNGSGSSGLGDSIRKSTPIQVGALTDWAMVDGGQDFTFGYKTDGTVWSWGINSSYQRGTGNNTAHSSPVQHPSMGDWRVVAGSFNTISIINN